MTQFEFVSAAVTIVLALGIARLLEGMSDSFDPKRRYGLHLLWVINKLIHSTVLLWVIWTAHGLPEQSFFQFLGMLATPSIFYLQVHALMTRTPENVLDWREHFWKIRRWFFAANGIQVLVSSCLILMSSSLLEPRYIPVAGVFLFSIVGYFSSNERVHYVIGILTLLNLVVGVGGFTYQGL